MAASAPPREEAALFLRGGAVGDFILTLPTLRAYRRAFPGQRLEVIGPSGIADLALHFGLAEAARRLDDPTLAHFFVPHAPLDPSWSAYLASFPCVVSYLHDSGGAFHDNLRRAGVRSLFHGPHRPIAPGPPAAVQLAAPLAELGIIVDAHDAGEPLVTQRQPSAPIIALHPGSGSPNKNWGLDRWAVVAAHLHLKTRAPLVIVAGEAETGQIDPLLTRLDHASVPHTVAHGLSLGDLATRLAGCRLFLGHDSGPSHLAAACGVPCVLVFGPTDPSVWAPAGPHVRVIRSATGSLDAVSTDEVLEGARAAWVHAATV